MEPANKIEQAIMPFKVQQLAEVIMQKKRIGLTDALHYLYGTNLYRQLDSDEAKWWYMSGAALYEIIESEKKEQKRLLRNRKLSLFLIFCIENYKNYTHRPTEEVLTLFSTRRVLRFLRENYDVLHTQGKEYIMEEIKGFLEHGGK
ncbi:MAG: DUF3791 domain-containing protein [Dysgonamonadaceae bacterium]|jgi:hypothetical protein|nr:DUF3791 domain-containing protein [Dysgonamonadaceae bacterium]